MDIDFPKPDSAICAQLADLHRDSLPSSALSALGGVFLRSFYRYAAASSDEQVIAARFDGETVAGALITHRPATLNRRLLFHTPLAFSVLTHLHAKPVREAIFSHPQYTWDTRAPIQTEPPTPELLALFSHANQRGKGVGSALIAEIDRQLSAAGAPHYFVRTFAEQDNPARRFYIREGFAPVGHIQAHGMRFSLLMKTLTSTPATEFSE